MDELEPTSAGSATGGHYGSTNITISLPFSKITKTDSQLRDAVAEIAALVARLAGDPDASERQAIAVEARELSEEVLKM